MRGMTLSRHILEQQEKHAHMRGELSSLLAQLGYAAKVMARELRRAALVGELGLIGEHNATGDAQKKLDVFANQALLRAFGDTGLIAALVSEELDEVKNISCGEDARYILCSDPLDGSSNTDTNGAMGTIFGFYRRAQAGTCATIQEILQKGSALTAAGYVLYGTSTMLVYSCGHGVTGFTLDHDIGEFLLSHEDIRCPQAGSSFSANLGRLHEWDAGVQTFVNYLLTPDASTRRPYSLRYSGALVADLHRTLLEGGIYFYPSDSKHIEGKLRLVYECAPLAYIVEQAGGRATTGRERIVDLQPTSIHQRVPFAAGSASDVALYEEFSSAAGSAAKGFSLSTGRAKS